MTQSDRRFYRRHSNIVTFAVSVAIAVGAIVYQPILDVRSTDRDTGILGPGGVSPRCLEADQASVAQLAALLQRTGSADAAILERANHTLSIARRHCLYGWQERALEDYTWLRRWVGEQG